MSFRWTGLVAGVVLLSLGSAPVIAPAATIRVAPDGSGDFTVLQDAVAAAQSGDTISLAPGHYTQTRWVPNADGTLIEVMALATQSQLTIVGDGRDLVEIGLEIEPLDLGSAPAGIIAATGVDLTLRDLTVSNVRWGVEAVGSLLLVERCSFRDVEVGVANFSTGGARVLHCSFVGTELSGFLAFDTLSEAGSQLENCSFDECGIGFDFQTLGNVANDCSITGGIAGAQVSFGGEATLNSCTFSGQEFTGFGVRSGSSAALYNCTITDTMECIRASGFLGGSGNTLEGGTFTTMSVVYPGTLDFHENHILNVGGLSVRATGGIAAEWPIDLTNNYWGTNDPDQIAEWIYDRNDDLNSWLTVGYQPFHGEPVSTETTSFGKLKAQFGPDRDY